MGIGRRLYDLLRANVGHYLRDADPVHAPRPGAGAAGRRRAASPGPGPEPSDAEDVPPPGPRRIPDVERAYRALELPYGAGPDEIRKAHRRLLQRYHPDRFARDDALLADATRLSQELTRSRDLLLEAIERGRLRVG